MSSHQDKGFTLVEVMLVVIILAILAAIAVPKLAMSSDTAREKADMTTGRQIKAALDRYQIEKGAYPRLSELQAVNGEVQGTVFIPEYLKKLDQDITQQITEETKRGFGIGQIGAGNTNPETARLIMIYLTSDGSQAEVKVYNKSLTAVLWSSD